MTSMNLKLRRAKRTKVGRFLCRLLGDERGAVAMEYVVIALLVAAAVVGIVIVFGSRIASMFGGATKALSSSETGQAEVAKEQEASRSDHAARAKTQLDNGDTMRGSDGKQEGGEGTPE
ncbi:MAG: hypothetical protein J6X55_00700 [Victivallales bacterium]|nr:hypothetical protein [Victivallales bacterium]